MRMENSRKDGYEMKLYTKILRSVVKKMRRMAGHCDGGGAGTGHCY